MSIIPTVTVKTTTVGGKDYRLEIEGLAFRLYDISTHKAKEQRIALYFGTEQRDDLVGVIFTEQQRKGISGNCLRIYQVLDNHLYSDNEPLMWFVLDEIARVSNETVSAYSVYGELATRWDKNVMTFYDKGKQAILFKVLRGNVNQINGMRGQIDISEHLPYPTYLDSHNRSVIFSVLKSTLGHSQIK